LKRCHVSLMTNTDNARTEPEELWVDPRKVNLAEADIEEYLWKNPGELGFGHPRVYVHRWLKRQYRIPNGVIDLLGVTADGILVVVEIKNTPTEAQAITQVKQYAFDIDNVNRTVSDGHFRPCVPLLIGTSMNEVVFRECEACGVFVKVFRVSFSLNILDMDWQQEYMDKRDDQYAELAQDKEFAVLVHDAVCGEDVSYGHT